MKLNLKIFFTIVSLFLIQKGNTLPLGEPWFINHEEGYYVAEKENRKIMMVFYADWNRSCLKLTKELSENKELGELTQQFVKIKIDFDQNPKLAQIKTIEALPTIIMLDPQGNELDRIKGFINTEFFADELKDALNPENNFQSKIKRLTNDALSQDEQKEILDEMISRGMIKKSLQAIETLIAKTPEEEVDWIINLELYKVHIHEKNQDWEQTIKSWDAFYGKYPGNEAVESGYFIKSEALIQLYKYEEARKVLEEYIQKFPTSPKANEARKLIEYTF